MIDVPEALRVAVGGHPLVAETLFRRGIELPRQANAFLDPQAYEPTPAFELPDLLPAARLIQQAIDRQDSLCVWGDFDVDGQTSTTLLVEALRGLGANVRYYIPDREAESHGFHARSLRQLLEQGVRLVVTCDTGISGHEAVDLANQSGAQVIITDHHDLPAHLPQASALINPKRLPVEHPLRELPGVGVAYVFAQGCYEFCEAAFPAERFLELAALGIVSDMAIQRKDVRYLLQRGLSALQHTSRPALLSLYALAGIRPEQVDEEQITFGIAPRLNSLGRMANATAAVEFLGSSVSTAAEAFAAGLEQLNANRKLITDQVFHAAAEAIEASAQMQGPALVITGQDWPKGVLGIVASRLVETFGKPALVLSGSDDGWLGGSARSIPGVDISAAIAAAGDLLERYGGHPAAAGLQMKSANLEDFKRRINAFIHENFGAVEAPALELDAYLSLADLDLGVMRDLARLAPFGPGNPNLVFSSRGHELLETRTFGAGGEHLKLLVGDGSGKTFELIRWRGAGMRLPRTAVDIAYTTRIHRYREVDRLQIEWVDARPAEQPVISLVAAAAGIEIDDWRWDAHPEGRLAALEPALSTQIWAEGHGGGAPDGIGRTGLQVAQRLIVWTAPPDRGTLQAALECTRPEQVIIVAADPGIGLFDAFLRELGGMVKFALRERGGEFRLDSAAEHLASVPGTVRAGLEYLAARGLVEFDADQEIAVQLRAGSGKTGDLEQAASVVQQQLREAAAFRAFIRKCELGALLRSLSS